MRTAINNPPSRPASIGALLLAFALACDVSRAQTAPPPVELLSHATDGGGRPGMLWVAISEKAEKSDKTDHTTILSRSLGSPDWHQMPSVPARAIGLTSHTGEQVVLLQNRTWAWYSMVGSDNMRFSYGPLLPDKQRILTLAGDSRSLWALGRPAAGSSRPAATTSAVEAADPAPPSLYTLAGNKWQKQEAPWPGGGDEKANGHELLSLAVIGDIPHLAVVIDNGEVRLYRFERGEQKWAELARVQPAGRVNKLKLIDVSAQPAIWIVGDAPPGQVWKNQKLVNLSLAGQAPLIAEMDLTAAGDELRLFFRRSGKVYEQRYGMSGSPSGSTMELKWTAGSGQPQINWMYTAILTAAALFILSNFARKKQMKEDGDKREGEE